MNIEGPQREQEKEFEVKVEQETSARHHPVETSSPVHEVREGVMTLPDDPALVRALQNKLEEYRERLNAADDAPADYLTDHKCRIALLERLLENGEVNVQELAKELMEEEVLYEVGAGKMDKRDAEIYMRACLIIKEYLTYGKGEKKYTARSGTGLNFMKEPTPEGRVYEYAPPREAPRSLWGRLADGVKSLFRGGR